MNPQGGSDMYNFINYPGMEYGPNSQAPVDVDEALSFLEGNTEPLVDFSNSPVISLRNSATAQQQQQQQPITSIPLRTYPANIPGGIVYTQHQIPPQVPPQIHQPQLSPQPIYAHQLSPQPVIPLTPGLSASGIPILPPPPPAAAPIQQSLGDNTAGRSNKRKKKDDLLPDEVCKGFDWVAYQAPQLNYPVHDGITLQPLGDAIDVMIYKSGTNTHFSNTEKAWISYRQNQFKIFCLLKLPQTTGPICLRDGAMDAEVNAFYAKLYAIRSTPMGITEEVQVGLYHAGKARVKKEKKEIEALPFVDGRIEYSNLQFERSSVVKGPMEYFHLVVTLYVKTSTANFYPILSRISPRIIVRSQHPGFYPPPSPEQQPHQQHLEPPVQVSASASYTSSEEASSPHTFEEPAWQQSGSDGVFRMGKVGINTSEPTEALTVHGNALITGQVYKPSDRRIKSDFEKVDSSEQLGHIRNLEIYDYKVGDRNERGVIAQELQQVMPSAVHHAGDVVINGKMIPDLLVVDERKLLYENLGATKHLDMQVEIGRAHMYHVDTRVDDLQRASERDKAELQDKIRSVADMFFAEEMSKDEIGPALKEEQVVFGLNLFRMGPARSFMVLGYFSPYLWLFGVLYIFSSIPSRKVIGRACVIKFVAWWCLHRWVFVLHDGIGLQYIMWVIGLTLIIGNWRRNKRRMEARRLGKEISGNLSQGWKCWERTWLRRSPSLEHLEDAERS